MKVIKLESDYCCDYPIGLDINSAIHLSKQVSDLLLKEVGFVCGLNLWCRGSSGAILAGLMANNLLGEIQDVKMLRTTLLVYMVTIEFLTWQ